MILGFCLETYACYDTKRKKRKNSKNAKLTKLVNSCNSIFKHFYEYHNETLKYGDLIYYFKAFGMTNLQYEVRIPQKIYNRATITEKVYYENY